MNNDNIWYAVVDKYGEILGLFPSSSSAEQYMHDWNRDAQKIGDVSNEAVRIEATLLGITSWHHNRIGVA